jgi:hypothetical protein
MDKNHKICCNVNRCKFNDQERHCTLDDIVIGNTTPTPHAKKDTECDSFEESM